MLAHFRVAGHYGGQTGASTSKTKKKVLQSKIFLSLITIYSCRIEISGKSPAFCAAFLLIHRDANTLDVRSRAKMRIACDVRRSLK